MRYLAALLVLTTSLAYSQTTVIGGASGSGASQLTDLTDVSAKRGNSTQVQMTTGSVSTDDCAKFDANGNIVSAGGACGAGGGAPTDAEYWLGSADGTLSAEIVVNDLATLESAIGSYDFNDASNLSTGTIPEARIGAFSSLVNINGGFEVADFRCTASAGVLTCQDPTASTGDTNFIIKGGAGESGNAFEVQNSSGTVNAAITATGVVAGVSAVFGPVATSRIAGSAGFYADIPEITPSGNPAANVARLYSADDGGTTKLYYRDSAGTDTEIGPAGVVSSNTIGTDEIDDGSDTPVQNHLVGVNAAGDGFHYIEPGFGITISGGDGSTAVGVSASVVDTTSDQTLEAKTLLDPSLGDDSGMMKRVKNASSPGTTVNRLAKIRDDGSNAKEAVIAGTSDTGIPVWVVSSGAGTTGNAELAIAGEVQADADGACDVGDNVIASTSTGGEVSCTPTAIAQDVFCVGVATQTTGAAGLVDVAVGDLCTRVEEGVGVPESIEVQLFNGGSALAASSDDGDRVMIRMGYSCDITSVETVLDVSGSIVVDIWKDTYANLHPTNADSITASAPPTVSGALKSQDSTLTGWTTQINAGDYLMFNIDSASTATWALLSLQCTRD